MTKKIAAIVFIYICVTIAWFILGGTVLSRTYSQDVVLRDDVGQLWGTEQRQSAPVVTYYVPAVNSAGVTILGNPHSTQVEASDIAVNLDLEHRRKGLLWYSTYRVQFEGAYRIVNDSGDRWRVQFTFPLPAYGAIYDDFRLLIGERRIENVALDEGKVTQQFDLGPGQSETVVVAYNSQGLDEWWYDFGENVAQVRNFSLVMTTDFAQIDFPAESMSPSQKEQVPGGWKLTWAYTNLLSGRPIAMLLPHQMNPGPWASKVIFFAPVSLFLFFFLLFLFTTVRNVKVHPMNYFFIGAAFFSYHLLLAYLVDHVSIHLAFWICSAVSIFLVVTYMRLVVGTRFALVEVGISQFVYLVLFSYTFFFEGYTGLVVTIMCIVTLFVVMQFTGRVDWEATFRKNKVNGGSAPPPGPASVKPAPAPAGSEKEPQG